MAGELLLPWDSQPQHAVSLIDPLTFGPAILASGDVEGSGPVTRIGTLTKQAGQGGIALRAGGGAADLWRIPLNGRGEGTAAQELGILVVFRSTCTVAGTWIAALGSDSGSTGNSIFGVYSGSTTPSRIQVTVGASASNSGVAEIAGTTINDGNVHTVLLQARGFSNSVAGSYDVWLDGVKVAANVATPAIGTASYQWLCVNGLRRTIDASSVGSTHEVLYLQSVFDTLPDSVAANITRNPWQLFQPHRIPVSGTRRPAKRKTRDMLVPWDRPPVGLVKVDPRLSYAFNAGSGAVDLATGALSSTLGATPMYLDRPFLSGQVTTVSTDSKIDNRSAFVVSGIGIRSTLNNAFAVEIRVGGSYGWMVRIWDYGSSCLFQFIGAWSDSVSYSVFVPTSLWVGNTPVAWAFAVDIPNLTCALFVNGVQAGSGALSWVPDPIQSTGTVTLTAAYAGNSLSQVLILPGADISIAAELSIRPFSLYAPLPIPFNAGTPITTRREVSEMLLPWDQQPQGPVEVDRSSSLFKGLDLFYTAQNGMYHARRDHIVPPTAIGSIEPGRSGMQVPANASGPAYSTASMGFGSSADELTVAVLFEVGTLVNNGSPSTLLTYGGQSTIHQVAFNGGAVISGVLYRYPDYNGSDYPAAISIASGQRVVYIITFNRNGSIKTFSNGKKVGESAAGTFATTRAAALDGSVFIHTGVARSVGTVAMAMWSRELSEEEVSSFSGNVWQLFKPRSIPFDQPALIRQLEPLTPVGGNKPHLYLT